MDTNSKRRAAWRRDEMERRRTERGRQRSQMMLERKKAAQTEYMARMGERAKERIGGDLGRGVGGAIAYGESLGEYADRRQGYMSADMQRKVAEIKARSPEAVEQLRGRTARDRAATEANATRCVAGLDAMTRQRIASGQAKTAADELASRERIASQSADVEKRRIASAEGIAGRQLAFEQQQANRPQLVEGLGAVSFTPDGKMDVTSMIDIQESGLSDEERAQRAYQRSLQEQYRQGNWFSDVGTYLFGLPGDDSPDDFLRR